MTDETLFKSVETTYSYLYALTYGNEKYEFKWSDRSIFAFNEWAINLDKRYKLITLGKNFIINYFLFHYARLLETNIVRYSSKDEKDNVTAYGRFQIYDFISSPALKKWIDRNKKFDFCIKTNHSISKYVVSVSYLSTTLSDIIDKNENDFEFFEENIRIRFFGQKCCIHHCMTETTMFNPNSVLCTKCISQTTCREIQKNRFPEIFKSRNK